MESQERLAWLSRLLPGGPCSFPTAQMLSASQTELKAMMNEKTGKLLELRRELEKEMELRSEECISYHCSVQIETFLEHIKKMKDEYQDEIEEMVDKS